MSHIAQSTKTIYVQDLSEKLDMLHKCTKTTGYMVTYLAEKYETVDNRMNTFKSNSWFFVL